MTKKEWGTKRVCLSCGTRFYDLLRQPIICPRCDAVFDPEQTPKSQRRMNTVDKTAQKKVARVVLDEEIIEGLPADDADLAVEDADDDDSGLLEDASDLGEDDDDMAEVMENIDEEEGSRA